MSFEIHTNIKCNAQGYLDSATSWNEPPCQDFTIHLQNIEVFPVKSLLLARVHPRVTKVGSVDMSISRQRKHRVELLSCINAPQRPPSPLQRQPAALRLACSSEIPQPAGNCSYSKVASGNLSLTNNKLTLTSK